MTNGAKPNGEKKPCPRCQDVECHRFRQETKGEFTTPEDVMACRLGQIATEMGRLNDQLDGIGQCIYNLSLR